MKKIFLIIIFFNIFFISLIANNIPNDLPDEYIFVDLGLPSKTLWAKCNVGAHHEEEFGDYFSWGEIDKFESETTHHKWWENYKTSCDWCTYKHMNQPYSRIIKYCTDKEYGYIDGKYLLDPEDDAASCLWGVKCNIPSVQHFTELIKYCKWEWTTINSVKGYKVSNIKNHNIYIFLPAANYIHGYRASTVSGNGWYWTRNLHLKKNDEAGMLFFNKYEYYITGMQRSFGLTIRPIIKKNKIK